MVKNYWISTPYSAGNIGVVVNKVGFRVLARKDLIEARLAEIRDGEVSMRNYILGPNIF